MSLDKVDAVYNTSTVMNNTSGKSTHLSQIHNNVNCGLTMVLGVVKSYRTKSHVEDPRGTFTASLSFNLCRLLGESGKGELDIRLWKVRSSVPKTLSRISEFVKGEFKKRFGLEGQA